MKHKLIRDKELPSLMRKLRAIVGSDTLIVFKTAEKGSRFVLAQHEPDDNGDDSEGDFDDEPRFERHFPKIKKKERHLRPTYFG